MKKYYKDWRTIAVFLFPGLVLYFVFEIVPILQTGYFSVHQWSGIYGAPFTFVGIRNYVSLWNYPEFWQAMKNILQYVVLSLFIQVPFGYFLAFLLATEIKGFRFFKAMYFTPLVVALSAVGLMFYFILMPNTGALEILLENIGLESLVRVWLTDPGTALNTLILVTAWVSYPFYLTIGFAAITSVPTEILEASTLDGCSATQRNFYVIIPMIWESIKISVVLLITGILKIFEIVFVMTQGGPNGLTQVPVTLMYYEAFRFQNYGRGSAVAVVVFLISLIAAALSLRLLRRDEI